jgi:hypothetical protein
MIETLFSGEALWFSVPAVFGTGMFVLRLLMMLIGGDGGDGAVDMDFETGDAHLGGHDPGGAFEILSVQGVSAFLMGFGWVGVGALLGADWSPAVAFGAGFLGGLLLVWILGHALGAVRGLESSGNISISEALGATGDVYTRVPPSGEGQGQVRVVLSDRQRIYNAISRGPEFMTHTRVRVVEVNDDNSLTVDAV